MSDKIEQFWRDATADDVTKVWHGEAVEARFRDGENTSWYLRKLSGWSTGVFICDQSDWWQQCQVYDPPAILKNKPDPGEGWRLLEKFPHEPKFPTDEYWSNVCGRWLQIGGSNATPQADRLQVENVWYRRRIANNPTSSDSSRSRDNIPSGWRVLGKDEDRLASDAQWSHGCGEWCLIGDDRVGISNELPKGHAIRQVVFYDHQELRVNGVYGTPGGQTIRITAKGFEVM